MPRYLIGVTFAPGDDPAPMDRWSAAETTAHLAHYDALNDELRASGELVSLTVLTLPDRARVVRSDGRATEVADGPFAEVHEWLAGFHVVDVADEARAVEIAARVSAVPGRGGEATRQPVHVRPFPTTAPTTAEEMDGWLADRGGSTGA
ncbi:YciI family protein [Cellulomonas oligotrophica]|uniref:YCII-related domain-containing protein n=1 Tax=Cellulomonas oligotrophica TaxID=931536 RepID=A0A7Y9FGE3_9CELL|nr:YciI family protein [Cellulomonas oligotrophica]NYD86547.1 hypothetical protein [Cellulomonas oligotrophica]GIG32563.1 hypothetical protein Col01nite_17220 [Cellulomonas oligotrophica]